MRNFRASEWESLLSHNERSRKCQVYEVNAEIAQLVEHNLAPKKKGFNLGKVSKAKGQCTKCGNSSVGRAQPCQGWGREFEPRFPLLRTAFGCLFYFISFEKIVQLAVHRFTCKSWGDDIKILSSHS